MNICIAAPYFSPFIRSNEYGLAQKMSELGHKVTIVTSKSRAPREKMITERCSYSHDFEIKYLPTLLDIVDNPIVTSLDVRGFDVVMLQEDYPFLCHKAYAEAKKYGIPTVLSSERTYYPENIIKRYALKLLDAGANKKLREGADALTAHCTAAKEFMIRELDVKREIEVIHVGIDTRIFRPLPSRNKYLSEGDPRFLTVARLHPYKGLEYLIKSMELVGEKEPGAKLYILGKGKDEEKLRKLVSQLRLSNVIFIKEDIPNHMMPELYAECDVYVQPSIIEPYGIAVLEAMACGKPVVGTGVGGMLDTIDNERTGILVELGDSEALAEALIRLHDDGMRKKMGDGGRKRAEDFDWEAIGRKYMELLSRVCDRG